jgi:tetratricopeptide (TPR) repeat protein
VAYEQALALNPNDAFLWRMKGDTLRSLTRYEEAQKAFEYAIELDPGNPWGWNGQAYVQAGMKNYEALTIIERAIAIAPNDANFYDSKGEILMRMERYDAALPQFQKAVTIDPTFLNSWQNLVTVYRALGREVEAQEADRRVLDLKH